MRPRSCRLRRRHRCPPAARRNRPPAARCCRRAAHQHVDVALHLQDVDLPCRRDGRRSSLAVRRLPCAFPCCAKAAGRPRPRYKATAAANRTAAHRVALLHGSLHLRLSSSACIPDTWSRRRPGPRPPESGTCRQTRARTDSRPA